MKIHPTIADQKRPAELDQRPRYLKFPSERGGVFGGWGPKLG